MMESTQKPLRILVVVNLPWDSRLGAPRVWMELAEQWRAAGHVVEKYSLSDAFPESRATSAKFSIQQFLFSLKAAAFIRKNAERFDVIDALIGVLPSSKEKLGFRGLLVARSVGLYLLYDRFDRSVEQRWPGRPKGKLPGRMFYAIMRRRLLRVSEKAVRQADLVSVPNEEEAASLRQEIGRELPIVVQPYGLTAERRRAFLETAAAPEVRLKQKRVCFIGMWGPRKGSLDWSQIIQLIRQRVPKAQFRFLGTMIDPDAIRSDLGPDVLGGVEFVSEYQPEDLPRLLADCAIGAFPSYAEGFGLAVLEQLAAGLPTVAYDTVGPRDLLRAHLSELLVPKGDINAFAQAICRILQIDLAAYEQLCERSAKAAAQFSWPAIAEATLSAYRTALRGHSKVLFVQPFSLGSAGGGARILRALLEAAPCQWESICTYGERPKPWPNETHLPSRPAWGRIEYSRFAAIPNFTAPLFAPLFRRRLKKWCLKIGARAIHSVPHARVDFADVHRVARELRVPFFISVHDDLAYTAAGAGRPKKREAAMRAAWRDAAARFVISDALGLEYCRRYGTRDYEVVTDGLNLLMPPRAAVAKAELRVYFMGLFHMGYEANLRALLDSLPILQRDHPGTRVAIICRCEHIRAQVLAGTHAVTILPFANEAQVRRDMESADLLYLPMPFGEEHKTFVRYSLSTKMVTYVGSGVPILYHGPKTSAAYDLLRKNKAAVFLTSLVPEEIARRLSEVTGEERDEIARNALTLAEREFMLADQTRKFWGAFSPFFPQ